MTAFVREHPYRWFEYLPAVTLSMNTAMHSVTREAPFYLFYGRDFLPPSDKVLQRQVLGIMENPAPHNILASALVTTREVAKHYLHRTAEQRAERANDKRRFTKLSPGMRCYLDVSATKTGKFQNNFRGPLRLIKWTSPQNALIRSVNDPTQTPAIVHASRLKAEPNEGQLEEEETLPTFRSTNTQTHHDHKRILEKTIATQTEESATLPTNEEPQRARKLKQQRRNPEPTPPAEHRHFLRSKAKGEARKET
jgi:hypothetical protein